MPRKPRPEHTAADFDIDVMLGDTDMFQWFLLCYMFGKPIQSKVAIETWKLFLSQKMDNPWSIVQASERKLVRLLHSGGYTRYQHVTARGMQLCMERLIREYDGSLYLMYENSFDEDEFSKRLQELYGVGPKIAEIFMRETEEMFARRAE